MIAVGILTKQHNDDECDIIALFGCPLIGQLFPQFTIQAARLKMKARNYTEAGVTFFAISKKTASTKANGHTHTHTLQ